MTEQEKLPVCALCGKAPVRLLKVESAACDTDACDMYDIWISYDAWRRLMARPRLAPEHVDRLRHLVLWSEFMGQDNDADAIRAAIAALGEG